MNGILLIILVIYNHSLRAQTALRGVVALPPPGGW